MRVQITVCSTCIREYLTNACSHYKAQLVFKLMVNGTWSIFYCLLNLRPTPTHMSRHARSIRWRVKFQCHFGYFISLLQNIWNHTHNCLEYRPSSISSVVPFLAISTWSQKDKNKQILVSVEETTSPTTICDNLQYLNKLKKTKNKTTTIIHTSFCHSFTNPWHTTTHLTSKYHIDTKLIAKFPQLKIVHLR